MSPSPAPAAPRPPLRVALAGIGVVGGGVVKLLEANRDLIARRAGRPIEIVAVSARDRHKDRGVDLSAYRWEDDMDALVVEDDVDVVVEMIGGADGSALTLARHALGAGKAEALRYEFAQHDLQKSEKSESKNECRRMGQQSGPRLPDAFDEGIEDPRQRHFAKIAEQEACNRYPDLHARYDAADVAEEILDDLRPSIALFTQLTNAGNPHGNQGKFRGGEKSIYPDEQKHTEEVKRAFNPEFLNRLDDLVVFRSLEKKDMARIVDILINELESRLGPRDIKVQVSDSVRDLIVEKGFDPQLGARPLRRAIQKLIEDPLAEEILRGKTADNSVLKVGRKGDQLTFTPGPAKGAKKEEKEPTEVKGE